MLKKFAMENNRDWDENRDLLLFTIRESPQESLGYSPFELLFGKNLRGPLKFVNDSWFQPTPVSNINVAQYLDNLRNKLISVRLMARQNLENAQKRMKIQQKNAVTRCFEVGDRVLIFFPIPGTSLNSKYTGPYTVVRKISPTNYVIQTPGRRKDTQLVDVNLMKKYVERTSQEEISQGQDVKGVILVKKENMTVDSPISEHRNYGPPLPKKNPPNSVILQNLKAHLPTQHQDDIIQFILSFPLLTADLPGSCNILKHDIKLVNENIKPIK